MRGDSLGLSEAWGNPGARHPLASFTSFASAVAAAACPALNAKPKIFLLTMMHNSHVQSRQEEAVMYAAHVWSGRLAAVWLHSLPTHCCCIACLQVKAVFGSGKKKVAGCLVDEGKLQKGATIEVTRGKQGVVFTGKLQSLRRIKDNVDEVGWFVVHATWIALCY